MAQKLNLIIQFGPRKEQYPLQYTLVQNEAKLKIKQILIAVNAFISKCNIVVKNYLNIWVENKNGKQNLFKIRKNQTYINLILNENGVFQLKIILEDIQEKQNLLKFFHNNSEQYMRLSNNINRIMEQSKQEQKKRGQKSMRPIDIAYFFADPLVTVSKNKIIAQHEVSYQLQYDKFIELVKKEQFGNNFRIEMMVATKTNIKKTLIDGASILHFSCHGLKNGFIQIESEISVGQLVNLQHKQFMNLLDIKNNLPKLIIFNVCFSSTLAQMISSNKRIITIGYNHKILDTICQQFTKQFYMELFKYRCSVRQLFHIIKDKIMKTNPQEGKKLCIFPKEPFHQEQELGFFSDTESRLNFTKRWTFSQSMRQNDSLGVKSQIFKFIKRYFTGDERMSYFFLKGQPYSGKSDFMKKIKIYVMNRKVFTQEFTVDLRNKDQILIESMLQLRLQQENMILKKIAKFKDFSKQRRTNPIIIFDHTEKILQLQYAKFIEFIQTKIIKELKYGKVVIITNDIMPINKQQAQLFSKAQSHVKQHPQIEHTEMENFIQRYASEQIKEPAKKIFDKGEHPPLKLVQAIKKSRSQRQMQQFCEKKAIQFNRQIFSIDNLEVDDRISQFQRRLDSLQQCAPIKIQDNDYIFLSTIFSQIKLQSEQHYTNQTCVFTQKSYQIEQNAKEFNNFIKRIFKKIEMNMEFLQFMRQRISYLMRLSLRTAALLYIYREFNAFQKHLLDCQKLYILILRFYLQEIETKGDLYLQVSQYHLKILITLYAFYTQNQSKIKYKQLQNYKTQEQKQHEEIFHHKAQIIIQQIQKEFSKGKLENMINNLQSLVFINQMGQQLHYNKIYKHFAQDHRPNRRNSQAQIMESSNDEGFDSQEQTALIDQEHEKIVKYWKAFEYMKKNSKGNFSILKQKSIQLMEILLLKKIGFNSSQLQVIIGQGQSFLSQNTSIFINYYITILENIQRDNIFDKFGLNGLFFNHLSEAMKPLYQQYLKAFISIYFRLLKNKQNLSKQYRLPIYYELISLCEKSHSPTSIKKQIQIHINNQFFNTWTCPTFVSLPLVYEKGGCNIKYNIKRFQNHVYNFIKHFYENQIDKQVKFQYKIMGEELLSEQEQEKRHLIQLIICDCVYESQKIYLQDITSKSRAYPIRSLYLPKAPVTIYFGKSVSVIEQLYKQNNSIVIWINIDKKDRDMEQILQKQKTLNIIDSYNNKLGIYYNILEYFYCSFCRHFFNGTHSLFIQQVKNSYDLAKAQTIIKTKILYSSSKQFYNQKQINMAIDKIESNLQYLTSSRYGKQLKKIPAYHFIYKQKKFEKASYIPLLSTFREIGCNNQIHQLLLELNKLRLEKEIHVNFIIYYKSDIMLQFFIQTLKIKLLKINKFALHPTVDSNHYQEYYKARQNMENKNPEQSKLPTVIPFVNLQQNQIMDQLNSPHSIHSTIKIFFTQKKYISIVDKRISLMSIKESYKTNKVQFQFYYLYCKTLKSNIPQKKLMNSFKEVTNQVSSSLFDIKVSIQKIRL